MRQILLTLMLVISSVPFLKAQEKGPEAEKVQKEIIKIEDDKIPLILQSGDPYADWLDHFQDDDLTIVQPDGSFTTKARSIEAFRKAEFKVVTMKQEGHKVSVYAHGTTAVVSYHGAGTFQLRGETFPVHQQFTDVWVKEKDGVWRRVSHNIHNLPLSESKSQGQK